MTSAPSNALCGNDPSKDVRQLHGLLDDLRRTVQSLIESVELVVGEVRDLGLMVRVDTVRRLATLEEGLEKLVPLRRLPPRTKGMQDGLSGPMSRVLACEEPECPEAEQHQLTAAALQAKGDFEGALREHKQALELRQAVVGEMNPKVGESHYAMASSYDSMKMSMDALACYEKALHIFCETLGYTHAKVGATWYSMGLSYNAMEQWAQAQEAYEQALWVLCQALGEDNPTVANICNNLAVALHAQGRDDEAKLFHERVLRVRIACFGDQHKKVGDSHYNIAALYGIEDQRDREAAMQHYERCHAIYKEQYGPDHAETIEVEQRLAHLVRKNRWSTSRDAAVLG